MEKLNDYKILLKKSKLVIESEQKLEKAFIAQVEHTRKMLALTKTEFSKLLGISLSKYSKMVCENRNIQLSVFLNFCRLFGFDLSRMASRNIKDTREDNIKELTTIIASFNPDTISQIKETIIQSKEPERKKELSIKLIDSICSNTEGFILFADDIPDNHN